MIALLLKIYFMFLAKLRETIFIIYCIIQRVTSIEVEPLSTERIV